MKVLIIGFTKISYMPYMHFYIQQLRKHDCEIHLLYWNRDEKPDSSIAEKIVLHKFDRYQEDSVPLRKKIGSFLGYRRYAKKILNENSFDIIVVLHTTPGVLLFDKLRKHYKNEYILDYRDFTYENLKFYKTIVGTLIKDSLISFVSSDGYRSFLPDIDKLYTSHNIVLSELKYRKINKFKEKNENPIIIRFWGFIRHKDINLKVINRVANDSRFELHFHGREQKEGQYLKNYCLDNKIGNVYFHGEYTPENKYDFVKKTDLIHNIYENDIKTRNAMGNKFYDGITHYIPQLCSVGSYMGDNVKKYNVGLILDVNSSDFTDDIYNYYRDLNRASFVKNCDEALNNVLIEYHQGINKLDSIISRKKEK